VNDQAKLADVFRARHHAAPPLLLPNAWDGASARILVAAGFDMIATTSAGMAWAVGYADGEAAPWTDVLAATARIVRAARGHAVTADIEGGYAPTPDALAARITEVIRTGIVGVNLEDGFPGDPAQLLSLDEAAARIRAARGAAIAAGVPIVINARIDLFLASRGRDLSRFDEAVTHARAYLAAGADCLYPIGLSALEAIARFVVAVDAPVNIMAQAGGVPLRHLEELGVARVSTASAIAVASLEATDRIAQELQATGRFDRLGSLLTYRDIQQLFA
jgi:2-methylisocitrate lyase-like PEP mutase family enzyme